MKIKQFFLACLFIIALTSSIQAVGVLYSRPRFSDQQYKKMWIKTLDASVDIQEQIAVTRVDQVFYNEMNTSVEAVFIFPLPQDAMVSELVYWVNGKRFVAAIRERQDAVADYNQKVRQWMDPALLEYLGNNLFRLSIVPIAANTEVRTEITYVEPLKYEFGKVKYNFKLNTLGLSSQPLKKVMLNVDATSKSQYKSFTSPSHSSSTATKITRLADNHYTIVYGDENYYPDKDFALEFETQREKIEITTLTYTPSPSDSLGTESFYAVWLTPPDSLVDTEIIPKDIVFTVDVSSSMDGKRLAQIKECLNGFLQLLKPRDRFNIVPFGTFINPFKSDLVESTPENIAAAGKFVSQLYALGLTNIDDALSNSLKQSFGDSSSNNIVFLTDGRPTWGDTSTTSILAHVKSLNKKNVRIFPFGVGDEVSQSFLAGLATENHGLCKFIASDDSIALIVQDHFLRISKPVLTDIALEFGALETFDQYPKIINDLFWGSRLMQLGLYKKGTQFDITLRGKIFSKPVEFKQTVSFTDTAGGHRFVPRLWAQQKINHLLNLITIYGESTELVNQIIELSLRFQILTPYTAFYVDPTTNIDKDKDNEVPGTFALEQNYPNPFNPETVISYSLSQEQSMYHVVIKIYDILGRLVKVLVDENKTPGSYSVSWNGMDLLNKPASSGIYFYSLQTEGFSQIRKMILLR